MLTVVQDADEANGSEAGRRSLLDEIVRDGARQMLAAALQSRVAAYVGTVRRPGRRGRPPVGSPQRVSPRARGIDRCGCGHGERTAGQR